MTVQTHSGARRTPWRIIGWSIPAVLLVIPLVAGFPWTPLDYVFAAVLFGLVGLCIELGVRSSTNTAYRIGVGLAVLASFLLLWLNAAVGIIGNEDLDANMLFLGVIAVALGGSFVARFRAVGMSRAMVLAAVAQVIVPFAAYAFALAPLEPLLRREVPVLTTFFTGVWLLSAWLFRRAGRA
jgi:hypothetical protein